MLVSEQRRAAALPNSDGGASGTAIGSPVRVRVLPPVLILSLNHGLDALPHRLWVIHQHRPKRSLQTNLVTGAPAVQVDARVPPELPLAPQHDDHRLLQLPRLAAAELEDAAAPSALVGEVGGVGGGGGGEEGGGLGEEATLVHGFLGGVGERHGSDHFGEEG